MEVLATQVKDTAVGGNTEISSNLWNGEYNLNAVFRGQFGKHAGWTAGNALITATEVAPGRVLCEFDNFDLTGANDVARTATSKLAMLIRESFPVDHSPTASRVYGMMTRQGARSLQSIPPFFADTSLNAQTKVEFEANVRRENPEVTDEQVSEMWRNFCLLVEEQRAKRDEQKRRRTLSADDAAAEWRRTVRAGQAQLSGDALEAGREDGEHAVEVFLSYAHEDEELRDALGTHLRSLERQGVVKTWHDREIMPGDD